MVTSFDSVERKGAPGRMKKGWPLRHGVTMSTCAPTSEEFKRSGGTIVMAAEPGLGFGETREPTLK